MTDRIFELLQTEADPLSDKTVSERLGVPMTDIQPALDALLREGRIAMTKRRRYATVEALGLVPCHVTFRQSGTPIAHPINGEPTMAIEYSGGERCLPDDLVIVRPNGTKCMLHSIAARGKTRFPAYVRFEREHRKGRMRAEERTIATAVPCDPRMPYDVTLTGNLSYVKNDQIALLEIEKYPEFGRPIVARVLRVLGNGSSMSALLRAIAEDHGFDTELPAEVEREAAHAPDAVRPEDLAGREDLRDMLIFTIDGATAKDFDDAVSIDPIEGGARLGVHIADVSHYVRPHTAIDADALERGTSLYLPGLTVPMLPECLSNHMCSLMPHVDRLALSLFMDVRGGEVVDHRLVKSVIHSKARLTYSEVNRLFEDGETEIAPEVQKALSDMLNLSHAIRARRVARGAIDFEMEQPEFVLDEEGIPTDVICAPRGESERMIEDFMLSANETVARLARVTELPLVYRIHEEPDDEKLKTLEKFLMGIGLKVHIGEHPHPGRLQAVLDGVKDHPLSDVVRHYLLRALKRAQYSEKPLGHYALAMEDYCHFTSPIRRYPDLIVHRMLKRLIDGEAPRDSVNMAALAKACSSRESEATRAERLGDDIMMAAYMSRNIGRKFNGVISGVTSWGLYVTLENRIEGLVHVSTLDDYFSYDAEREQLIGEWTCSVYCLGDPVRVRVDRVNVPAGEINFTLVPQH